MNAAEKRERNNSALELKLAGASLERIKDHCKYRNVDEARAGIMEALELRGVIEDPVEVRRLELARLDSLTMAQWPKAQKGDVRAFDRIAKATELRVRLAGQSEEHETPMLDAFNKTVDALGPTVLDGVDDSVLEIGRTIARQVDAARLSLDASSLNRALFLIPHLMGVLRELGATPEARNEVKGGAPSPKQNDLEKFKNRGRSTATG